MSSQNEVYILQNNIVKTEIASLNYFRNKLRVRGNFVNARASIFQPTCGELQTARPTTIAINSRLLQISIKREEITSYTLVTSDFLFVEQFLYKTRCVVMPCFLEQKVIPRSTLPSLTSQLGPMLQSVDLTAPFTKGGGGQRADAAEDKHIYSAPAPVILFTIY